MLGSLIHIQTIKKYFILSICNLSYIIATRFVDAVPPIFFKCLRKGTDLATNIINSGKKVHVYALDTFTGSSEHVNLNIGLKGYYDIFLKNCQEYIDKGILTPIQSRSDDVNTLARFDDKHFQGIIIDGAHEYEAVMDDILNWWPKLKDGGVHGR